MAAVANHAATVAAGSVLDAAEADDEAATAVAVTTETEIVVSHQPHM
jgi:hypothetical protein